MSGALNLLGGCLGTGLKCTYWRWLTVEKEKTSGAIYRNSKDYSNGVTSLEYKYLSEIVLLDFAATRRFKAAFANTYKKLPRAAIKGDEEKVIVAAERLGFAIADADPQYREMVLQLLLIALEPVCTDVDYDFARSTMARQLSALAEDISGFRDSWRAPPTDAVYFHRKVAGMFLLATRLKARVNVYQLVQRWL